MTVSEKREHSVQNVHLTIISTEVNLDDLQVNVPRGSILITLAFSLHKSGGTTCCMYAGCHAPSKT